MHDKVPYEYAIIRIVPKVERGECINVGVIMFSKKRKYIGIKVECNHNRIQAFAPDIDINDIESYLKAWELVCQGGKAGGPIGQLNLPVRFRWLVAARSSIIQASAVHPGLTNDPAATLQTLFDRFIK